MTPPILVMAPPLPRSLTSSSGGVDVRYSEDYQTPRFGSLCLRPSEPVTNRVSQKEVQDDFELCEVPKILCTHRNAGRRSRIHFPTLAKAMDMNAKRSRDRLRIGALTANPGISTMPGFVSVDEPLSVKPRA